MIRLVKYECRKILGSRLTKISIIGCCLFILFCVYSSITQITAVDENGNTASGIQAVENMKQTRKSQILNQYNIDTIVKEYLDYINNPATGSDKENMRYLSENMYKSYFLPNNDLLLFIERNYNSNKDTNIRDNFKTNYGKDFYQARTRKIKEWMDINVRFGVLKESETSYWIKKDAQVGDFQYGYYQGWRQILNNIQWIILIMMIVCIGIAPIFAGEYQSKSDSLILCMKYGKNKLIKAKILSSFIYTSALYFGIVLVYSCIYFLVVGAQGGNLPIQLYDTQPISYCLTMNQATIIILIVGYMATLCMMGFTLFISSIFKNPYTVIIIDFLLISIPMFLFPDMGGYLWRHVLALLPPKISDFSFANYLVYPIGGIVLNLPEMMVVCYGILVTIFSIGSYFKFKSHQVNG